MPAVLCYGATERNGGRDEARRGLAECRRFIRRTGGRWCAAWSGCTRRSPSRTRRSARPAALCRELGTVLHVHVAEDARRRRRCRGAAAGTGPLERLERLGALPPGSILAHGVHLSRGAGAARRALGCWLVQNPRSNQGNRVGYPAALRASARVALGTDGYPSDMAAERRALLGGVRASTATTPPPWRGGRRPATRCWPSASAGTCPWPPRRARPDRRSRRDLRAQAAAEAQRLWARMAQL